MKHKSRTLFIPFLLTVGLILIGAGVQAQDVGNFSPASLAGPYSLTVAVEGGGSGLGYGTMTVTFDEQGNPVGNLFAGDAILNASGLGGRQTGTITGPVEVFPNGNGTATLTFVFSNPALPSLESTFDIQVISANVTFGALTIAAVQQAVAPPLGLVTMNGTRLPTPLPALSPPPAP